MRQHRLCPRVGHAVLLSRLPADRKITDPGLCQSRHVRQRIDRLHALHHICIDASAYTRHASLAVIVKETATRRPPLRRQGIPVGLPVCPIQRCVRICVGAGMSEFGFLTFVCSLKVVDLSSDSESEAELPNPKRTPGGTAKRQRITYDDDESPGLDQEDDQV